jgi:hypothetical protein
MASDLLSVVGAAGRSHPLCVVQRTRQTLKSTATAVEVWEKEPDIQAIRELFDRALGKPEEQPIDVNVSIDWDKRGARMRAARKRLQASRAGAKK